MKPPSGQPSTVKPSPRAHSSTKKPASKMTDNPSGTSSPPSKDPLAKIPEKVKGPPAIPAGLKSSPAEAFFDKFPWVSPFPSHPFCLYCGYDSDWKRITNDETQMQETWLVEQHFSWCARGAKTEGQQHLIIAVPLKKITKAKR